MRSGELSYDWYGDVESDNRYSVAYSYGHYSPSLQMETHIWFGTNTGRLASNGWLDEDSYGIILT